MSFQRGCVVRSTAGRDKADCLQSQPLRQAVSRSATVRSRKLLRPKIKNPKHLEPTSLRVTQEELAFDSRLRRALRRLEDETASL